MPIANIAQLKSQRVFWFPFLLVILFFITGCSALPEAITGTGQPDHSLEPVIFSSNDSIGQTFTTRQSGLTGLDVFLIPQSARSGTLSLELYPDVHQSSLLAKSTVSWDASQHPDWVRFSFSPGNTIGNTSDLFFVVRFNGQDQVGLGAGPGAAYIDGSAYRNGQPLPDQQLAFRLLYAGAPAAMGLVEEGIHWIWLLALAALVFIFPGWVLMGSLWKKWQDLFWEERLGLAIGASLAIYPLVFLWTDLVGLHLGWGYAALPAGAAALWVIWKAARSIRAKKAWLPRLNLPGMKDWPVMAAYLLIAALVFGVRLYTGRPISIPLWGDSLQHTVIVRLMLDHQGMFQSWQPYAEMQGLSYHFGFHSLAAVYAWVSGMSADQSVIWFGQILNGLAILAIVPLAYLFTRNRWAGVFALLIAGLLSSMPMVYVNWGRYTQLAGQAILPFILYMGYSALSSNQKERAAIFLAGLGFGGLALTHYRILILAVLFFVPLMALDGWKGLKTRILKIIQIGAIGGLLFLPWFIHIFGGAILSKFNSQLSTPASAVSGITEQYNSIGTVTDYMPAWLWVVWAFTIAWGLWRRERAVVIFAGWILLVFLATNPSLVQLPGAGAISNFAILIAVYLPVGVFGGAAAGWLAQKIQADRFPILSVALLLLVVALGVSGGKQRLRNLELTSYSLAARPDIRAANWIRANLPADANFLVNSFLSYGDTTSAGSDGGWWLRYLSGRQTTLPPLLYGTETPPTPDYAASVKGMTTLVLAKGVSSPETLAELSRRGVNYVYIGQQQGRAGYGGPYPLEPAKLLDDPQHYQPVYHQDRVWIFKINQ